MFTRSAAFSGAAAFPSLPPLDASELAWTHAAEPVDLLRPDQTLRYVAASLDGQTVHHALHLTELGYTPRAYRPPCVDNYCGPPNCDTSNPCFASVGGLARAAAPTQERLFVLSASRGELFVIGSGIDALSVTGGPRRTLYLGAVALGALRAATYDVLTDRLIVLDEVSGPGRSRHRTARLVAIDASSGAASVVASWRRGGPATRFALGAAQDGALYLASSGDSGGHVLVSVSLLHHPAVWRRPAWDEVVTRGIGSGPGVVGSRTTYASRFAVTFVVERDGHAEVASYDPSATRFHAGDCMGDVF